MSTELGIDCNILYRTYVLYCIVLHCSVFNSVPFSLGINGDFLFLAVSELRTSFLSNLLVTSKDTSSR